MKLSARTLQILKNFTLINKSIAIEPGSTISTVSANKEILASATVVEKFTQPFAILDLGSLLGVLSLFEDPDIEFETNHLRIANSKESVSIFYTVKELIPTPPDKEVILKNPEIAFVLPQQTYSSLIKALNVLQLPSIGVIGDRDVMKLTALDAGTKTTNNRYETPVGNTPYEFKIVFNGEHFKLLPEDYEVEITSKGISHFKGGDVQYWIAANGSQSTFRK